MGEKKWKSFMKTNAPLNSPNGKKKIFELFSSLYHQVTKAAVFGSVRGHRPSGSAGRCLSVSHLRSWKVSLPPFIFTNLSQLSLFAHAFPPRNPPVEGFLYFAKIFVEYSFLSLTLSATTACAIPCSPVKSRVVTPAG